MKKSIEISPHIATLFGTRDENLRLLEAGLNIKIDLRPESIELEGAARDVARAEQVFADYDHLQRSGYTFQQRRPGQHVAGRAGRSKVTACAVWPKPGASAPLAAAPCSPRA